MTPLVLVFLIRYQNITENGFIPFPVFPPCIDITLNRIGFIVLLMKIFAFHLFLLFVGPVGLVAKFETSAMEKWLSDEHSSLSGKHLILR